MNILYIHIYWHQICFGWSKLWCLGSNCTSCHTYFGTSRDKQIMLCHTSFGTEGVVGISTTNISSNGSVGKSRVLQFSNGTEHVLLT
jgi:hypothetical protein